MSESLEELPLFPLRTVLFPHATLRLHVFEERYRIMVQECLRTDGPFGIALIRDGEEVGTDAEPYLVGTVARITEVQNYDDGRMDVTVRGERRFRIRELDESRPYLLGRVQPVEEHGDPDPQDPLVIEARDTFEALVQRYFERQRFAVQVTFPPDPRTLSFAIADHLPVDDLVKQRLLEITDTLDRLEEILPYLRTAVRDMQPASPLGRAFSPIQAKDLDDWTNPN